MNTSELFPRKPVGVGLGRPLALVLLLGHLAVTAGHAQVSVLAWGDNNDGECNVPAGLTDAVALAGGGIHSLALRGDGTVIGWGNNGFGEATPPPGLTNVVAISAGYSRSLALTAAGTVVGWGLGTLPPAGLTNVSAISAGWSDGGLALLGDTTVLGWGTQSNTPAGLSNVVAVAAGGGHALALQANGTVVAWGTNFFDQATVPAAATNVVAIAAGQDHSLALRSDHTVVAWGANYFGQTSVPSDLTNVVAIAAGAFHSLALKSDGTLAAWGNNAYSQSVVRPTLSNFVAIAAGGYHSLGIRNDGTPVILLQPASQSPAVGEDVFLQVMAAGAPPLLYQWSWNGTNLAGATNATLVLRSVQTNNVGSYSVIVSNGLGTVTSTAALVNPLGLPPTIVAQPLDQTTFCSEGATFQVTAGGTKPFAYQWQLNNAPIPGATNRALVLNPATTNQAGPYSVVVTNIYGAATSAVAVLTVIVEPPLINSPLTVSGKQGVPFTYTITGIHNPTTFGATNLPAGLSLNTTNGVISGIPLVNGTFAATIQTINACASDTETLTFTLTSSVPVITGVLTGSGTEGTPFTYQITATESPTGFSGTGLPPSLAVDPATGLVSGTPVYSGTFDATIAASNIWGVGTATLHLTISNAPISGLSIANVKYAYSSPYLLDFQFSLRDNNDPTQGQPIFVPPQLLSVTCMEDGVPISPSETAFIVVTNNSTISKQLKAFLVLDFTESIASLSNGDTNQDGISDAVDSMVNGAENFVNQMPSSAQLGVYEFHRDDQAPQQVTALTRDKTLLDNSIAGIWTNYVQGFPAGSRCWDALVAAITSLGTSNRDEQHLVLFVSDGSDTSSTATITNVVNAATNSGVQIYCIGFGNELNTNTLQFITSQTQGRYYTATNASDLATQFALAAKDLNGQYFLRWATLQRSKNGFTPSFQITYQGLTALSPSNTIYMDTNNPIVDTNTTPPTTNYLMVTNLVIAPYFPSQYTGSVLVGSLRLSADAAVSPSSVTLRAFYVPRYIRQLRLHYRANWATTARLESTGPGELLDGWSLTETNDGAGGAWLLASSPYPASLTNSIPFGALGNLINFSFEGMTNSQTAFSMLQVDNTLYTNTGGQSFVFDTNLTSFLTIYPALPHGTPGGWLQLHGFPVTAAAELTDPDHDGMLTWQEFVANTDPRNSNSVFVVRSLLPSGPQGQYQITFSTSTNRQYRVQFSTDLVNWQTLQDNIPGIGADVTVTDNVNLSPPQIYYRVQVYLY